MGIVFTTAPGAAPWPTAEEMALGSVRSAWEPLYDVGYADGVFCAFRRPDGPLIRAATVDGLDSAIRADHARGGGA
jgi:hypothetical protein